MFDIEIQSNSASFVRGRHDFSSKFSTCWERYLTSGFKDLVYIYGATKESYRKTSESLNRFPYQPKEGPSRVLSVNRPKVKGDG